MNKQDPCEPLLLSSLKQKTAATYLWAALCKLNTQLYCPLGHHIDFLEPALDATLS
jgi:hypothetical protein